MNAPLPFVALDVVEAEELAEMLEFVGEFLSRNDAQIRAAFRGWIESIGREYSVGELVEGVEAFARQIRFAPVVWE